MGCTWDNSASNQPIIDGVAKEPVDVAWGEGTSDEMCLGGFYATAQVEPRLYRLVVTQASGIKSQNAQSPPCGLSSQLLRIDLGVATL